MAKNLKSWQRFKNAVQIDFVRFEKGTFLTRSKKIIGERYIFQITEADKKDNTILRKRSVFLNANQYHELSMLKPTLIAKMLNGLVGAYFDKAYSDV